MKRAMIIGSEGQDGRILFDRLSRDHLVLGIGRNNVRSNDPEKKSYVPFLKGDVALFGEVVGEFRPEWIYYLAAVHHSSEERDADEKQALANSFAVHVTGLRNVLDAMRVHRPDARLFYAATSHIFGDPPTDVQDEQTPIRPTSIYGITKAVGVEVCRQARRDQNLFAAVGILYNHESPLRPESFVSQKIISAAARIARGSDEKLVLGDLNATVDWGYAPDYVDAMIRILDLPQADDFIIATGEPHTVREFVELAFGALGLDWERYVVENPDLLATHRPVLVGNPQKLKATTGWRPSVSFPQMIRLLLQAKGLQNQLR